MSEVPSLRDLDYDADRVLRLLPIETAEGVDPQAHRRRIEAAVPGMTRDDLGATVRLSQIGAELAAFEIACMDAMTDLLRPLGFMGDSSFGEVLAAIPNDWSERDNVRRLLAMWAVTGLLVDTKRGIVDGTLDLDAAAEWAMSRGILSPDDDEQ